jgi:hypothetical protein
MKPISVLAGLTALLLTAPLMRANALTIAYDVAANGGLKALPYKFVFTSNNSGGLIRAGITVAPGEKSLPPYFGASLHLMDDKTELATIALAETREDGTMTYGFKIAPALLAKSRFELDIYSFKEEKLPNGKTRFIPIPGTVEYRFNLRDYIAIKKAAKPIEEGRRQTFSIRKRF